LKRKTAQEILIDSFLELADKENVDRISIRDITENCGYSKATFYRQFKDKYDLIACEYSLKVENIIMKMDQKNHSFEDIVYTTASGRYVCSVCGYVYDRYFGSIKTYKNI